MFKEKLFQEHTCTRVDTQNIFFSLSLEFRPANHMQIRTKTVNKKVLSALPIIERTSVLENMVQGREKNKTQNRTVLKM